MEATVHYRVENGQDVATMIRETPTTAKNAKPKR